MSNGRVLSLDEVHSEAVDVSSAGAAKLANTSDVVGALVHLGMLTGINEAGIVAIRTALGTDTLRIRLALEAVLGGTLGHNIHEDWRSRSVAKPL